MATERFWPRRLRWRLKGAWMWPAFFALTLVNAILFSLLPVSGERGPANLAPALILAGCINIFVIAALAPLLGRLLRRRRRDLPRTVATDRAGTALLLAVTATVLTAGLLHRDDLQELKSDRFAAAQAAHRALGGEFGALDAMWLQDDLYRVCRPAERARRHDCVFVNTDQSPPGIERDPSRQPNDDLRVHGGFR